MVESSSSTTNISFESHQGILADYSPIMDMIEYGTTILINNQDDYKLFQESIARSLMVMVDRKDGKKGKPDVTSKPNTDEYLTKKVDFEKDHLIISRGKQINKISVSRKVYLVEFGEYTGDNQ